VTDVRAHVISRRPHLVTGAVDTATRIADTVVVGLHGITADLPVKTITGTDYVALTNELLAYGPSLRIDDDDYYPDDHGDIFSLWKPGHTVWGIVTIKACDGTVLQADHPDMCAGVIPPITVYPDAYGRIADSIRKQTEPIYVETGVVKHVCLADITWLHNPAWRRINCSHTVRGVADAV